MRVHNQPRLFADFTDKDEGKDLKRFKYVANCTSYICTRAHDYGSVVKHDAKITDVFCHKCGSALFWERFEL